MFAVPERVHHARVTGGGRRKEFGKAGGADVAREGSTQAQTIERFVDHTTFPRINPPRRAVLGAAGGAYAGNEIEKNTKKRTSYRVRVRMADDSIRTLYQRDIPGFAPGDKVEVVDGAVVARS